MTSYLRMHLVRQLVLSEVVEEELLGLLLERVLRDLDAGALPGRCSVLGGSKVVLGTVNLQGVDHPLTLRFLVATAEAEELVQHTNKKNKQKDLI